MFATGYETPEFLDRKIVRLRSTFALATAPMERFDGWGEDRCLIRESARPYLYARTTGDGRAVIGGADPAATGSWRGRPPGSRRGSRSCFRRFRATHGYFALGYGGNGITFSWIAARLLLDRFLGRRNADGELFDFDR